MLLNFYYLANSPLCRFHAYNKGPPFLISFLLPFYQCTWLCDDFFVLPNALFYYLAPCSIKHTLCFIGQHSVFFSSVFHPLSTNITAVFGWILAYILYMVLDDGSFIPLGVFLISAGVLNDL